MEVLKFDVVVAGAGPSGCAAAIALKLAGLNVCLVDKEHGGGRKVGESIPGASVRLLNRLGINGIGDLLDSSDYRQCLANVSAWGTEEWIYQPGLKNPEGGGYHINRANFDEALRQKAAAMGIALFAAMIDRVDAVPNAQTGERFILELKGDAVKQLSTKWIIDATGRKTAIGRKFGINRKRIDSQMAAVNWISAPATDNDHATRIKSVPEGWWYTSLLPDQSRVIGFQGLPEMISLLHKNSILFFEKFNATAILPYKIDEVPVLQSIAVEAGIAKPESVIADGLICVGDAALSFDPLSSQGIFFALYSGIRGAETIINCFADTTVNNSLLDNYQLLVDRIFTENQKSLRYFYMSEPRYLSEPYWQSRRYN